MLDHCSILTQGGLVLWSRSFTGTPSPVDTLIREALIEERSITTTSTSASSSISSWDKDGYALLWTLANELEIVFVVAYQRILQLSYVEQLLEAMKKIFIRDYEQIIRSIVDSVKGKNSLLGGGKSLNLFNAQSWADLFKGWDETFTNILRQLEMGAKNQKPRPPKPLIARQDTATSAEESAATTPTVEETENVLDGQLIAKNIAALKARQKPSPKGVKSNKLPLTNTEADTGSDTDGGKKTPVKKQATKWANSKVSAADLAAYDYSSDAPSSGASTPVKNLVAKEALGKRSKSGLYEVADYATNDSDDEDENEPETSTAKPSALSSLFSRLSLTPKALAAADLAPVLETMRSHLMNKNVAKDIAEQVCEGVGKSLIGKKVSGFGAVKKQVKIGLEQSLTKILTPKTSTDLLLEIQRKKSNSQSSLGTSTNEPYSITFVGVNGVGKSTNLSKVAFWLLQNKLRVLIAACDTFRSGAVEQLRVHVKNLGQLGDEIGGVGLMENGKKTIELYEKGYGKDAAGIAKEAIAYGKQNGFDVVLIDTAGRMQDNEPLMRALAKLVTVNSPDKIVFVGEALVGNEAVDQLTKFNRSLRDFSGVTNPRGIDGMILTKFDTIDDKVGAALSMTYVTGQPILFVGTGQTYSDLRSLRVAHIVQALMQD